VDGAAAAAAEAAGLRLTVERQAVDAAALRASLAGECVSAVCRPVV
jgi:hypothetical protein